MDRTDRTAGLRAAPALSPTRGDPGGAHGERENQPELPETTERAKRLPGRQLGRHQDAVSGVCGPSPGHRPKTGEQGRGALTLSKPGEACVPGLRYSIMCDSDAWFPPRAASPFPSAGQGGPQRGEGTPGGRKAALVGFTGGWCAGELSGLWCRTELQTGRGPGIQSRLPSSSSSSLLRPLLSPSPAGLPQHCK